MMNAMGKTQLTDVNKAYNDLIRSKCKHNFLIVGIGKQDDSNFMLSLWCVNKCKKTINISLNIMDMLQVPRVEPSG